MVKGTSRQVILVQSPDRRLFEQAIFIVREDAQGVSDEALLQEAQRVARQGKRGNSVLAGFWALCGGAGVGLVWLVSSLV